jgi:hypothetical protein
VRINFLNPRPRLVPAQLNGATLQNPFQDAVLKGREARVAACARPGQVDEFVECHAAALN